MREKDMLYLDIVHLFGTSGQSRSPPPTSSAVLSRNGVNKWTATIRPFIQVQCKTHLFCLCFVSGCWFKRGGEKVRLLVYLRLLQQRSNSARLRLSVKINDEYKHYKQLPSALLAQQGPVGPARPTETRKAITAGPSSSETTRLIASIDTTPEQRVSTFSNPSKFSQALMLHKTTRTVKPTYHAPWKLVRVISGHLGWVRSVAVEPGNKWFATGAGDRVIKIWNLASGELRLSLTGHISTVRGLAVSPRHPYLFSCGEDKVRLCHVFVHNLDPNLGLDG